MQVHYQATGGIEFLTSFNPTDSKASCTLTRMAHWLQLQS